MKHMAIPHGDVDKPEPGKGAWSRAKVPSGFTALMACPGCGRSCCLTEHEIDDAGNVDPSVVCPHDDCTFHRYVTLERWAEKPGELTVEPPGPYPLSM